MIVSVGVTVGRGLLGGRVVESEGRKRQPDPEVSVKARGRVFSSGYKLRILAEYDAASAGEKSAILRWERLYSAHIVEWCRGRDAGALAELSKPKGRPPTDDRDRELEALRARTERLEKELTKAQFVIDMQGKVAALSETLSESVAVDNDDPNSRPNSSR